MQVNRRYAMLDCSKKGLSTSKIRLSVLLGLPLMWLAACGTESVSSPSGENAGVRDVIEWHDPDYKTTKLAVGKTRYGKEFGEWTWFFPSGEAQRRGSFEDGVKSGPWLSYHPNGQIAISETYVAGKLDGPKLTFYEDGSPKETVHFDKGLKSGDSEGFYLNGTQFTKTSFIADHATGRDYPQGKFETFHDNGQLATEVEYVDGLKSGGEYEYHYDGSKGKEILYEAGKRVGPTRGWFANGTLQLEGTFVDDRQQGIWKQHHPNGQLALEGAWEKGVQVGLWRAFHEDGSPKFLVNYEYSNSVKKPGAQNHGLVQEWSPAGTRLAYGFLKFGDQFGTFYRWDDSGALQQEYSGHFRAGQRVRDLSEEEIAEAELLAADLAPHDPATPFPKLPGKVK